MARPFAPPSGKGTISARFRNANIALFATAFFVIIISLLTLFSGIVDRLTADYAKNYAVRTADAFAARISIEIGLLSKAASSGAVTDWFADETNEAKKTLAFAELSGIIDELYSRNLYAGLEGSRHEYQVAGIDADAPFTTLNEANIKDA